MIANIFERMEISNVGKLKLPQRVLLRLAKKSGKVWDN